MNTVITSATPLAKSTFGSEFVRELYISSLQIERAVFWAVISLPIAFASYLLIVWMGINISFDDTAYAGLFCDPQLLDSFLARALQLLIAFCFADTFYQVIRFRKIRSLRRCDIIHKECHCGRIYEQLLLKKLVFIVVEEGRGAIRIDATCPYCETVFGSCHLTEKEAAT